MSQRTPQQAFIDKIQQQKLKEKESDIWKESPFKDLPTLQSNNVGNVGESFIQVICDEAGIEASIDGLKTKKIGGGEGDGSINGKTVEIKTAHQGIHGSFQHELGERPWHASHLLFLDVATTCKYLIVIPNFSEEHYKNGNKCEPYFPTKKVTWRKGEGAFKLDTTLKIDEECVKNGFAIKITHETTFEEIGVFLKSKFS